MQPQTASARAEATRQRRGGDGERTEPVRFFRSKTATVLFQNCGFGGAAGTYDTGLPSSSSLDSEEEDTASAGFATFFFVGAALPEW